MTKSVIFFRALAVCLLVTSAVGSDPASAAVPAPYREGVQRAVKLGQALYMKDRAAWVATDELARRGVLKSETRVRGWVSQKLQDGLWRVSFMGGSAVDAKVYHSVDVLHGRAVGSSYTAFENGATPSTTTALLWKARITALAQRLAFCPGKYNAVVLPIGDDVTQPDGIIVYLLWATTDPEVINIGGHFRVDVDPKGETIVSVRALSNTCLSISKQPDDPSAIPETAAVMANHPLAPHPEEHHVFASLVHDQVLVIGTDENRAMWVVDKGQILFFRYVK